MLVSILLLLNFGKLFKKEIQRNKIKAQNGEEIKDKMCVSKYKDVVGGSCICSSQGNINNFTTFILKFSC